MQNELLLNIREGRPLSFWQRVSLSMSLSYPAILAQLSSIIMQYIDAAMVGRLGSNSAAAIGLVASTTWVFGGVSSALVSGFAILLAQAIGAKDYKKARSTLFHSYVAVFLVSIAMMGLGIGIHKALPVWLKADVSIHSEASIYFLVYACSIPVSTMNRLAGRMLSSTGNMKVPGFLNSLMCAWDVLFNYILIFGLNMGVAGAALGTMLSELVTMLAMLYVLIFKTPLLKKQEEEHYDFDGECIKKAFKLSAPIAFERFVVSGASIVTTAIVAPLGVVPIAANSFAITAESLCYMPGYGIGEAATTLVGQSIGADRKRLAYNFAWITTIATMIFMTITGAIMYIFAPDMMSIMSKDTAVIELGAKILRIEAFAEPFFGASIVVAAGLRGDSDTLIPSIMNLVSLWAVRIPLSFLLVKNYGLTGVWVAMCAELIFRGSIFLVRLIAKSRKNGKQENKIKES